MKLTMSRKGEFRCNWANTHGKCGIGPELNPVYTYHCVLETADILDSNGFVFDQLLLDKYFQTKYGYNHTPQSCEKIAIQAVNDVKRMVENHMLGASGMSVIYRIAVTIGIGENTPASLTAEWVPEKSKPVANVKRVKKALTPNESLMKTLDEVSREVESWPAWKRSTYR